MKKMFLMVGLLVLVSACGQNGSNGGTNKTGNQFLMSGSDGVGENKYCADFSVDGTYDNSKIPAAKNSLKAQLPNPSETPCDQTGTTGVCTVKKSNGGLSVTGTIFLFATDRSVNKTTCGNAGTYTDR